MDLLSDFFKEGQQIAGMLYFDFLEERNVFNLISIPIATERLFYELHWPMSAFNIGENILRFLSSFNIVKMEGGTVSLGRKSTYFKKHRLDLADIEDVPMYHFVSYGLRIFADIIDGNDTKWNLRDHLFTLEFGIIYTIIDMFREEFRMIMRKYAIPDKLAKIAFIGFHPEWFLAHIKTTIESPEQIKIYVENETQLQQAVDVCELQQGTSQYSQQIKIFNENEIEDKYDFVVAYTIFTSKDTFAAHVKIVKKLLKKKGALIYNAFSYSPYSSGIEPLLNIIESFENPIDSEYVFNHLKAEGFKCVQDNHETFFKYCVITR